MLPLFAPEPDNGSLIFFFQLVLKRDFTNLVKYAALSSTELRNWIIWNFNAYAHHQVA